MGLGNSMLQVLYLQVIRRFYYSYILSIETRLSRYNYVLFCPTCIMLCFCFGFPRFVYPIMPVYLDCSILHCPFGILYPSRTLSSPLYLMGPGFISLDCIGLFVFYFFSLLYYFCFVTLLVILSCFMICLLSPLHLLSTDYM